MRPLLFANPQIGQAYANDPRVGYAQALLQQGASTQPVQSLGEAFARALQAPLGGFLASRVRGGYETQDQSYRQGLAAALKGDDIVGALSNSSDPTLQMEGLQQQLALGQARAKAKIDLQNQYAAKGLQLNADGSVTPVPKFGQAMGSIANETAMGTIPSDVAKQQALIPGEVNKAVAVAQGTMPIDVQKAVQTAQATAPIDVAKQQQIYNTTQGPQQHQNNIEKLRDDVRQDPNIKNYQTVAPIIESMKKAAVTDTRAADLNLVYGIAKIMDPGSVVREGEQVLVQDAGALGDKITNIISAVNGGQRLTSQTRQELLAQAQSRVDQLKGAYDQAATFYGQQAQNIGAQPTDIFYDMPAPSTTSGPGGAAPKVLRYDNQGNLVQ